MLSFINTLRIFPAGIHLLKVNNKNTITGQCSSSGVFMINFEHI